MKKIVLTRGKVALVDDEDFERINQYKWFCSNYGYAVRSVWIKEGKTSNIIWMHRFILNASNKFEVDHINGNRLDNQKHNLRLATNYQNAQNVKKHKDNTSGFKGISYCKHWKLKRPWKARICVNKKLKALGYFSSKEKAYEAYCKAARQYFGEFARI